MHLTTRRLFSAVLQWVLRQCWTKIKNVGFDLGNTLVNYVSLDILLVANSGPEVAQILDKSMSCGIDGFSIDRPQNGHIDKRGAPTKYVCDKGWSHLKGSRLESRAKTAKMHIDGVWRYDAAPWFRLPHGKNTKSWHANRWMLKQKYSSICTRPKYFNACVQAMSCCGSAHRTLSQKNISVHLTFFRKLPQSPSNTDLSLAWYFLFIEKIGPGPYMEWNHGLAVCVGSTGN